MASLLSELTLSLAPQPDFSKAETENLLANCKVRPAVHQMERHPYLPQHKFVAWHKEVGLFFCPFRQFPTAS